MQGKRKLIWSPQAREQWKEILRFYTKRNGSADYSRRLNKKLLTVLRMLRQWPEGAFPFRGNVRSDYFVQVP